MKSIEFCRHQFNNSRGLRDSVIFTLRVLYMLLVILWENNLITDKQLERIVK